MKSPDTPFAAERSTMLAVRKLSRTWCWGTTPWLSDGLVVSSVQKLCCCVVLEEEEDRRYVGSLCCSCCRRPCFGRGVGLDDPQRSLPTPAIPFGVLGATKGVSRNVPGKAVRAVQGLSWAWKGFFMVRRAGDRFCSAEQDSQAVGACCWMRACHVAELMG